MKHIIVTINAKPRTCGECRWWTLYAKRAGQTREPWCRIWKRWLDRNRHHIYRCDECLRAEREAE